ncbi:MAG: hypothetical protein J5854_02240 [Clostridia bacterium]|nr:hypothetical protein [Clostridia bacterium]
MTSQMQLGRYAKMRSVRNSFIISAVVVLIAVIVIMASCVCSPRSRFKSVFGFDIPKEAEIENYSIRKRWKVKLTQEQYEEVNAALSNYLSDKTTMDNSSADDDNKRAGYYSMNAFNGFYDLSDEYLWSVDIMGKSHRIKKVQDKTHIAFALDDEGYYHMTVVCDYAP